jgi:hypothetical protein
MQYEKLSEINSLVVGEENKESGYKLNLICKFDISRGEFVLQKQVK